MIRPGGDATKFARVFACGLAGLLAALGSAALAQTAPPVPAVQLVTAPLANPASLAAYYGTGTTHTAGAAAWTTTPPEIVAEARALGAGRLSSPAFAQNVYNYVRNNIATEFHFGLAKGGRGALIDQSGTAFDQADLMVKLLRQGGVTANYQLGTITLNAQQFGQWSGFIKGLNQANQTFVVDGQAACQFLADGGIPATVNGQTSCANVSGVLTTVTVAHIWVQANSLLYDPAYKSHTFKTGVDVAAAANCGNAAAPTCGSKLTTAVMTGATTGTLGPASAPTVQNLNEGAAMSQMVLNAQAVQSYIQTNQPAAALDDIIGGARIDTTYYPTVGASLPYTSSAQFTWTGDVPDQYRSKLTVQFDTVGQTFFSDEISSRRLRAFLDQNSSSSYQHELFVDDTLVQSANSTYGSGNNGGTMTLTATHPYAAGGFANQTLATPYSEPTTIVQSWGESTPSTQKYFADLQAVDPSPYVGSASASVYSCTSPTGAPSAGSAPQSDIPYVTCRADGQTTLVAMLHAQRSAADGMVSALAGVSIVTHHTIGSLSEADTNSLTYYSLGAGEYAASTEATVSIQATTGLLSQRGAAFEASSSIYGHLEGLIGQQSEDAAEPISSISGLVQENRHGEQFLFVTPATMANTLPSSYYAGGYYTPILQGSGLSFILVNGEALATAGVLGPIEPVAPSLAFSSDHLGYLMQFVYKGGGAPLAPDPAAAALQTAKAAEIGATKKYISVDPASGDLTLTPPPDIVTGSGDFPYSLPLQRTYQSGSGALEAPAVMTPNNYGPSVSGWRWNGADQDDFSRLGAGWTYNYQIGARIGSDGLKAMGKDDALDASAAIAGVFTLVNVLTNPGFNQRLASFMATYWLGQQLVDNTVVVHKLPAQEVFTKLPSGAFNPPAGSAASLTQSGGRVGPYDYVGSPDLISVSGWLHRYDYAGVAFTYTDRNGSTISFDTASSVQNIPDIGGTPNPSPTGSFGEPVFKATRWAFPNGVVVNFNYSSYSNYCGTNSGGTRCAMPPTTHFYLTSIENSLGRQLNFTTIPTGAIVPSTPTWPGGAITDIGREITSVTDENGRTVQFSLSNCPTMYANNGGGLTANSAASTQLSSYQLGCNTFTAKTPDGATTTYSYAAGSDSPDPSLVERPSYRLRRWYTPSNTTTPYQTVVYDPMYRVDHITDILVHTNSYYPSALFSTEWWKHTDIVDALNATSTDIFDQFNDLLSSTDPLGRTTSHQYDALRRRTVDVSPESAVTLYSYDVRSNLLSTARYPKGGLFSQTPITTSTSYNEGTNVYPCANPASCNEPASQTDAMGHVTNYSWDNIGELTRVQKPANLMGQRPETDYAYGSPGAGAGFTVLTQKVDLISGTMSSGASITTQYAYGDVGSHYALHSALVDYGGFHLLTQFTFDGGGNGPGNLTAVQNPRTDLLTPAGQVIPVITNYTWDANRRLTMQIQPAPASGTRPAMRYSYDLDGELIQTDKGTATQATGSDFTALETTQLAYDAAGNNIQTTVLNGTATPALSATQTSYDADDRPVCTAVRMNPAVYGALPYACVLSTANPSTGIGPDQITAKIYDAAGQVTQEQRGVGTAYPISYALYAYSPDGKQTSVTDANNNLTSFVYDGWDRLVTEQFPKTALGGTPASDAADSEAYTYDPNDNLLSVRRRDTSVIGYTYDPLNREIVKSEPGPGGTTVNVYTSHDLLNRTTAVTYGSPGGAGVAYAYDSAGRLASETTALGTVSYAYDGANNRTQINWPASSVGGGAFYVNYSYDALNHVMSVTNNASNYLLASFTYDSLGRRTRIDRSNSTNTTYGYDNLDRLTGLTHTMVANNYTLIQTLGYSPASQLISVYNSNLNYVWALPAAANNGYAPNGLNQNAQIAAITGGGYDGRGNEINDGTRQFSYDAENRLLSASGPTPITASYDPLGRLQQTAATSSGTTTTTQFLYAGSDLIGEYDGAGNLKRRYVPGPGTDEPLVWFEYGVGTYWLYADHQGSIVAQADNAATPNVQIYTYGPYGEPNSWSGSRFRYTGQIMIPEARLYHYKARAYDPIAGWFLQTDPVGYKDNLDLYAYVGDDPIDHADPTGKMGLDDVVDFFSNLFKQQPRVAPPLDTTVVSEITVTAAKRPAPKPVQSSAVVLAGVRIGTLPKVVVANPVFALFTLMSVTLCGDTTAACGPTTAHSDDHQHEATPVNPDRPSDRAIKHQCISQCTPVLEQPDPRGRTADFEKCVNQCIKEKTEYWDQER